MRCSAIVIQSLQTTEIELITKYSAASFSETLFFPFEKKPITTPIIPKCCMFYGFQVMFGINDSFTTGFLLN